MIGAYLFRAVAAVSLLFLVQLTQAGAGSVTDDRTNQRERGRTDYFDRVF